MYIYIYTVYYCITYYKGKFHDLELIGTLVIVISVVCNDCWGIQSRKLRRRAYIASRISDIYRNTRRWGTNPYYNNSLDDLKQSLKLDEKYIKVRVPDASNPAAWTWKLGAFGSYRVKNYGMLCLKMFVDTRSTRFPVHMTWIVVYGTGKREFMSKTYKRLK